MIFKRLAVIFAVPFAAVFGALFFKLGLESNVESKVVKELGKNPCLESSIGSVNAPWLGTDVHIRGIEIVNKCESGQIFWADEVSISNWLAGTVFGGFPGSLKVSLQGLLTTMQGKRVFTIDRIEYLNQGGRIASGVPLATSARLLMEGFRLDEEFLTSEMGSQSLGILQDIQFDWTSPQHSDMSYAYDAETGEFHLDYETVMEQAGKADFSLRLGRVDPGGGGGQPWWSPHQALGIVIKEASYSYTDESLVPKLLSYFRKHEGLSKRGVLRKLRRLGGVNRLRGSKRKLAEEAMAAVRRFLDQPATIALRAQPTSPVSFQQLVTVRSESSLIDLLGLRVVYSEKRSVEEDPSLKPSAPGKKDSGDPDPMKVTRDASQERPKTSSGV